MHPWALVTLVLQYRVSKEKILSREATVRLDHCEENGVCGYDFKLDV